MAGKEINELKRIRQHVIDLIATGEGEPIRIPSSRVLAKEFGVTHTTVQRAIRNLVDDGFLTPCKRGGALTNFKPGTASAMQLVGLLVGNGKILYETHYHHRVTSEIGLELTRRNASIATQNLFLNDPNELERLVENNRLSGLVAIGITPPQLQEKVTELAAKGFPAAAWIQQIEGVDSFYFRNADCCRMILERLFEENRRRIILVLEPKLPEMEEIRQYTADFCAGRGLSADGIMVLTGSAAENLERIRTLLHFGARPEAVVSFRYSEEILELLRRHLDLEEECRSVNLEFHVHDNQAYSGYVVDFDFRSAAGWLADRLLARIGGEKELPPVSQQIPMSLKLYRQGKPVGK